MKIDFKMSRIKYYIFVFLVLIASRTFPQNSIEGDVTLEENKITVHIENAESEAKKGNYYDAIDALKKALLTAESIQNKKQQGIILSKIASHQYNIGDVNNANSNITKAINVQSEIDDKVNLSISRYTKGLVYLYQKDYSNALDYFKSARNIFEEEELNDLIAEVTLSQAEVNIGLKTSLKQNHY